MSDLREIDSIVLLSDSATDLEVKNYLARFAVVRLSGFLDSSLELMMKGFLEANSSNRVLRFSQSRAGKPTNLNPAKLEALLGSFDPAWRNSFAAWMDVDERRQTLGNLIGARHALAHGGSAAVSAALLRTYQSIAEDAMKVLMDLFLPMPAPRQ